MKINWKVRCKSPQFWLGLIGTIMSPILAYLGLKYTDLTTWDSLANVFIQFIRNPYLVGTVVLAVLSFIGVITDPTTEGIADSIQVQGREHPKTIEEQIEETLLDDEEIEKQCESEKIEK